MTEELVIQFLQPPPSAISFYLHAGTQQSQPAVRQKGSQSYRRAVGQAGSQTEMGPGRRALRHGCKPSVKQAARQADQTKMAGSEHDEPSEGNETNLSDSQRLSWIDVQLDLQIARHADTGANMALLRQVVGE